MDNIEKLIINSHSDVIGEVKLNVINDAEKMLSFKFPFEYKNFIEKFGALANGDNEIYGLGVDGYMNVVIATLQERKLSTVLDNLIVLENIGIGGILIVMNEQGEIYEYRNNSLKKIYDSFYDFIINEILI